jgi:hypothetical protein
MTGAMGDERGTHLFALDFRTLRVMCVCVCVCSYMVQLARIYLEMLQVYKMYSTFISKKIQTDGPAAVRLPASPPLLPFSFSLSTLFQAASSHLC